MATSKVSLKLLIDKKGDKVLFAEAGKEFVDFLFNLMALPVGTVIRLLQKDNMVGCLGKLYESIENLSDTYMQTNLNKDSLLKPKAPISLNASHAPLLSLGDSVSASTVLPKLYTCGSCYKYVTYEPSKRCPSGYCGLQMTAEPNLVGQKPGNIATPAVAVGGYVKGVVTYMVMDDLVVTPMSTISSITMLNKFNIKEVGALEERVVDISMEEGLKLLKESLQSKSVLTSVFLENSGG